MLLFKFITFMIKVIIKVLLVNSLLLGAALIYGTTNHNFDRDDYVKMYRMNRDYIKTHSKESGQLPVLDNLHKKRKENTSSSQKSNNKLSEASKVNKTVKELLKKYYQGG